MPIFTTEARTLWFVPSPQTTQTLSYRCTEFNCGSRRQVHQRNAKESRHRAFGKHKPMDLVHIEVSIYSSPFSRHTSRPRRIIKTKTTARRQRRTRRRL